MFYFSLLGNTSVDNSSNLERSESGSRSKKSSISLPEILRETTLQEFMEAIERVKASELLNENFNSNQMIQGTFTVKNIPRNPIL